MDTFQHVISKVGSAILFTFNSSVLLKLQVETTCSVYAAVHSNFLTICPAENYLNAAFPQYRKPSMCTHYQEHQDLLGSIIWRTSPLLKLY